MSKPTVEEKINGYSFYWEDQHLKIVVTRIKQHRDNRVTGWLMMTTDAEGYSPLLHQCELNFASSQTQRQIVNIMKEKYEAAQWDEVIEQVRYYVLERVRQGEPVETILTTDESIQPATYLVYPLLPEHQPTVLFGDPGAGKSRIANLLYICLALPWHDNPLGLTVPDHPTRGLILDWESDRNTTVYRIKGLAEGMQLGPIEVHYRRGLSSLADDIEQIQVAIEKTRAEWLIIDSLTAAVGGEIMKPETAQEFFFAIRKLNMTTFIIAQDQKDPELKRKSILGSSIFEYYSRSVWEIKKAQTAGEDEMHVALMHRKANESKLHKSLAYRFYFNEDHITISTANMAAIAEFNQNVPIMQRITEALTHGALTAKEIAENIDATAGTVSKTLSQMKTKQKVISLPGNKWGLAARG